MLIASGLVPITTQTFFKLDFALNMDVFFRQLALEYTAPPA